MMLDSALPSRRAVVQSLDYHLLSELANTMKWLRWRMIYEIELDCYTGRIIRPCSFLAYPMGKRLRIGFDLENGTYDIYHSQIMINSLMKNHIYITEELARPTALDRSTIRKHIRAIRNGKYEAQTILVLHHPVG